MERPEVTVAVPVRDRRERMLRCLDALLAQDHPSFEILVLDNESTDGTGEACAERGRDAGVPVRVERLAGSLGAIRNRAGSLARGEFLAFTDSDCLPSPGWLTAAVAALRREPGAGVVQGRTLPEVEPDEGWPATIHVESLSGRFESCNLVFRRDAFVASAGFDEEVGHFWEDTAAGFALLRTGWRAVYAPDALVHHDVTYPGFWWHVRRMQRNANLGPVVRRYPEIRREVLFWRVFLAPRDARFLALLLALALAPRSRLALVLALPYLVTRLQAGDGRLPAGPRAQAQDVVYDAARLLAMLRGSVRGRTLLL